MPRPLPSAPPPPPRRGGPALAVVIPANDEEAWIAPCLDALLAQRGAPNHVEVVVAANACRDRTTAIARSRAAAFAARGWSLTVLDIAQGGKTNALNRADAACVAAARVYLDADVLCGPELLGRLAAALDRPEPIYATGRLQVAEARSRVTRRYADLWTRLPFVKGGAVGAGLFAVNGPGRARWRAFPPVISDDTFVRVLFAPEERIEVDAPYLWPMVEGWRNLVRVRARQDAGVAELRAHLPGAMQNEGKARLGALGALRLLAEAPAGFAVYAAVSLAVRARRLGGAAERILAPGPSERGPEWARGR